MYLNVYVFAEPLFSAIPKPLLCVETARQCCANQPVAVPASPRDAPSGKRAIKEHTLPFTFFNECESRVFWLLVFTFFLKCNAVVNTS